MTAAMKDLIRRYTESDQTPDQVAGLELAQLHRLPARTDGHVAILLLDGDDRWYWLAVDTGRFEPVGRGGPHATRRDALEEAQDRVPSWSTVRVL